MNEEALRISELSVYSPNPYDVIIIKIDNLDRVWKNNIDSIQKMYEEIKRTFPNNKVLLLDSNSEVHIKNDSEPSLPPPLKYIKENYDNE